MSSTGEIEIFFRSRLPESFRDQLDRVFFFNNNQSRFTKRINRSIEEFTRPVIKTFGTEVAVDFQDDTIGQTLHVIDSNNIEEASLVGIVMYVRDRPDRLTIVHIVLHENCGFMYKKERINIASLIMEELMPMFRMIKGVDKVRLYYPNKTLRL